MVVSLSVIAWVSVIANGVGLFRATTGLQVYSNFFAQARRDE
jgi:hypothetical protein